MCLFKNGLFAVRLGGAMLEAKSADIGPPLTFTEAQRSGGRRPTRQPNPLPDLPRPFLPQRSAVRHRPASRQAHAPYPPYGPACPLPREATSPGSRQFLGVTLTDPLGNLVPIFVRESCRPERPERTPREEETPCGADHGETVHSPSVDYCALFFRSRTPISSA